MNRGGCMHTLNTMETHQHPPVLACPLASTDMHLFQSISYPKVSALGLVIPLYQQVPFSSRMENKLEIKYIQY